MRLDLHIENLVIHGVAPGEGYNVGDALERELARLLAGAHSLSAVGRDTRVDTLDAGAFEVAPGSTSEGVGIQLAKAIFGSLTNTRTTQS